VELLVRFARVLEHPRQFRERHGPRKRVGRVRRPRSQSEYEPAGRRGGRTGGQAVAIEDSLEYEVLAFDSAVCAPSCGEANHVERVVRLDPDLKSTREDRDVWPEAMYLIRLECAWQDQSPGQPIPRAGLDEHACPFDPASPPAGQVGCIQEQVVEKSPGDGVVDSKGEVLAPARPNPVQRFDRVRAFTNFALKPPDCGGKIPAQLIDNLVAEPPREAARSALGEVSRRYAHRPENSDLLKQVLEKVSQRRSLASDQLERQTAFTGERK